MSIKFKTHHKLLKRVLKAHINALIEKIDCLRTLIKKFNSDRLACLINGCVAHLSFKPTFFMLFVLIVEDRSSPCLPQIIISGENVANNTQI